MEESTKVASQGKTSKISVGRCAYIDSLRNGNRSGNRVSPLLSTMPFLLVHFDEQYAMDY